MLNVTRTLYSYKINLKNSSEEDARKTVTSLKTAFAENTFGYAQIVCKQSKEYRPKWKVLVWTTQPLDKSQCAAKLKDPSKVECKPKLEIDPLEKAFIVLIESIRKSPDQLTDPDRFLRRLNKIIIQLYQADNWPLKDTTSADVQNELVQFVECINQGQLSKSNEKQYTNYVTAFFKQLYLHNALISPLSSKIITSGEKFHPQGAKLYEKINNLTDIGVELILDEKSTADEILAFSRAFAFYAYADVADLRVAQKLQKVGQKGGQLLVPNVVQEPKQFEQRIARLALLLSDHDLKHNSDRLLRFTLDLMQLMVDHFTNKVPLRDKSIVSLVSCFQILVRDNLWIEYMESSKRHDSKIPELAAQLLSEPKTWQAAADLIVFLGNREFFNAVVASKLFPNCSLDEKQLNYLFLNLNQKLKKDGFKSITKKIYLDFLDTLVKGNKLHFLKSYVAVDKPDYFLKSYASNQDQLNAMIGELLEDLRVNLVGLDFSFMQDVSLSLEIFFSNPAYRILRNQELSWDQQIGHVVVKLFTRFGANPVKDLDMLYRMIQPFLKDLHDSYQPFSKIALSKIGEFAHSNVDADGDFVEISHWLKEVQVIYNTLKISALRCMPLQWQQIKNNGSESLMNRLCLHENTLYQFTFKDDGLVLSSLSGDSSRSVNTNASFVVSGILGTIEENLKNNLQRVADINAFSFFIESWLFYNAGKETLSDVTKLVDMIFVKMQETKDSVSFEQRTRILAELLNGISAHCKELISPSAEQLKKASSASLQQNLKEQLPLVKVPDFTPEEVNEYPKLIASNSVDDRLKARKILIFAEVRSIIAKSSLELLAGVIKDIESVMQRKDDELAYSKQEFVDGFWKSSRNTSNLHTSEQPKLFNDKSNNLLMIKEETMQNYGEYLQKQVPPINFILPNQAIAMSLCTGEFFQNASLLLKMGTGQGKSLVIAMSALHEAKKIANNPHGRVFVFTSYDHLAVRDHALAKQFFEKDKIKSICISSKEDVAAFASDTKVIYADIEKIDRIVIDLMLDLLQNKASAKQIEFLKVFYGLPGEEIRIILDEFDLLLIDLEAKNNAVKQIPNTVLSVEDVKKYSKYWPYLQEAAAKYKPSNADFGTNKMNQATGKEVNEVGVFNGSSFYLPLSVMRLSKMIARAKRVIGLSGTTDEDEVSKMKLNNPRYFEIPSSQNPKVFGTKIEETTGKPLTDEVCIRCHQKIAFSTPKVDNDVFLIEESYVNAYCQAIIADIRARKHDSPDYQRPILIFGDPTYTYKTTRDGNKKKLWDTLAAAIQRSYNLNEMNYDVSDSWLQTIARKDAVTLAPIKYGRGADIRVSAEIKEGLHVILATPVIHKRVRDQLIGRTGRMGRQGSWSAFTMGPLIAPEPPSSDKSPEYLDALHDLTKGFIEKMTTKHDWELAKKWPMFLGQARDGGFFSKINRAHAIELCGEAYVKAIKPEHLSS